MGDTNYIGSIVKILEKPIQTVFNDTDFSYRISSSITSNS
jgi:hypothetical protein